MIRVLVVEDSPSCRELLVGILDGDPRLRVIGVAPDGESAVQMAARLKPDVITMDIHLPRMDGFAATRRIMETSPTRIVMVTASSIPHEVAASFRALEAGALAVLGKPMGPGDPLFAAASEELRRTVALMAEVPVVRRWPAAARQAPRPPRPVSHQGGLALVAVGASTGGPLALQALLSALRRDFPIPVVIVQHISAGFAEGLAQWLGGVSGYPVRVAAHADCMQPGMAYVAPDGVHTTVQADLGIALSHAPPENGYRPAVACLFRSVAEQFGARAAGLLLTGMGHDGARELKAMHDAGALTMVQDSASAAVYGMPGEALRLGAADHVLAPQAMAAALNPLVHAPEGLR
ncbi:MAG TPA: chemotaxis-specific protein-glutamate methyltransferase CheB [Albitalea sp.]|nr:chemotaxis-specific protein-glutamate methyltransferase CheB [Albitalea sp.]